MRALSTLSLVLIILCGGCTKKNELAPKDRKIIDMKNFEEDLTIPTELYAELEKVHRPLALDPNTEKEEGKKEEKKNEGAEIGPRTMLKTKPVTEQMPFKVYLAEKTKGVLGGQSYELDYPAGGGLLDYKSFVQGPQPGYFTLGAEFDSEMEIKDIHVFYLSNAKVRRAGEKVIGNGCGRYFDLTSFWKDSMKSGGMELNTLDNRHVSLTAGTFFFVIPFRGKLRLAHLHIRDSRHKDLECPKN